MNHISDSRLVILFALLTSADIALAQPERQTAVERRIARLEQRVAQLERLLMAKSVQSVESAAAKLQAAQAQLRFSQRLYSKGYTNLARLKADELGVARARADLDAARSGRVALHWQLRIEVLEAEAEVAVAEDRLRYTEQMARRGYAAQAEIASRRLVVDEALQKLQQAKANYDQQQLTLPPPSPTIEP